MQYPSLDSEPSYMLSLRGGKKEGSSGADERPSETTYEKRGSRTLGRYVV